MSWTIFSLHFIFIIVALYNWSIQQGFFICGLILSLYISLIIHPKRNETIEEQHELEAEVREIRRNDRVGWSRELVEKKEGEIAALEKKYGMLEISYMVSSFLSMLLICGGVVSLRYSY
ncbi:hypothetical protein MKW94_012024 [Papaver nudicaule]|uniref:Uncharacterized protein n=1 Tax=Papaver nudicaule TaxID=74823 RepID=A0AA41VVH4_PAPNU|nr:hypothetical protein [Papaver nudicaule]